MNAKILFPMIAVAALFLAGSQEANAGLFHRRGCCQPSCCEAAPSCCQPEPSCCMPEPSCCQPEPSCCEPNPCCRRHCIRDFFRHLCHHHRGCCNQGCGQAYGCEASCCGAEPSCGCN